MMGDTEQQGRQIICGERRLSREELEQHDAE